VLFVDDDDRFAMALSALLETHGIDVVGRATTGDEGVRLAEDLRPDVVVMDLLMPVMDGVEATRLIAQLGISVVIVSGSDVDVRVADALVAGATASLAKSDCAHSLVPLIDALARGEDAATSG
jgi:NarL family two-component system response regulator LiaR